MCQHLSETSVNIHLCQHLSELSVNRINSSRELVLKRSTHIRRPAAPAIERSISCISTWRFHALCKATRAHHLSKRSERAFFFDAVPLKATATHWAACADAKTSPARQQSPRRSSSLESAKDHHRESVKRASFLIPTLPYLSQYTRGK